MSVTSPERTDHERRSSSFGVNFLERETRTVHVGIGPREAGTHRVTTPRKMITSMPEHSASRYKEACQVNGSCAQCRQLLFDQCTLREKVWDSAEVLTLERVALQPSLTPSENSHQHIGALVRASEKLDTAWADLPTIPPHDPTKDHRDLRSF